MLRPQERLSLRLRMRYEQAGFRKYHMGRFEEYGLYRENRRFLSRHIQNQTVFLTLE